MRHGGKPVIDIWGFSILNEVTADDGIAIVTTFKNAGGYVIRGVQQAWHAEMVENQPSRFGPVYRLAAMIQQWTVGSYDFNSYPGFLNGRQVIEDAGALRDLSIDSSVVVWHGGSSSNANPSEVFWPFSPDGTARSTKCSWTEPCRWSQHSSSAPCLITWTKGLPSLPSLELVNCPSTGVFGYRWWHGPWCLPEAGCGCCCTVCWSVGIG